MVDVPGTHIEKGLADLGKQFVENVARTWIAAKARAAAPIEGEAKEIAKNIEFEGELKRRAIQLAVDRETELSELSHRKALVARARELDLVIREKNWSNSIDIVEKAREKLEFDADARSMRDIEPDWLLRFFQYAGEVDEDRLKDILANGLADAAIVGHPVMSRKAIDIVRFFDMASFEQFQFAARYFAFFRQFPPSFFDFALTSKPESFNPSVLEELGLIKIVQAKSLSVTIGHFRMSMTYAPNVSYAFSVFELTKIGREIAGLINADVRARFDHDGNDRDVAAIWHLQRSLHLSSRDMERLAMALVQDISSSFGLRFSVTYVPSEGMSSRYSRTSSRMSVSDPIGELWDETDLSDVPPEMLRLGRAFFAELSNFDHALEMMPTDAAPLDDAMP